MAKQKKKPFKKEIVPSIPTSTVPPAVVLSSSETLFESHFYNESSDYIESVNVEAKGIIDMFHYKPLKVLELGTGIGVLRNALLKHATPELEFVYRGVDFSSFAFTKLQSAEGVLQKDIVNLDAAELEADLVVLLGVLSYLPIQGVKAVLSTLASNYFPLNEFILFAPSRKSSDLVLTNLSNKEWIKLFQSFGFTHIDSLTTEFSSKINERPYYLIFSCA